MNSVQATADASLGLLVAYAADMHAWNPTTLEPPLDRRFVPAWDLVGYITGQDAILRQSTNMAVSAQTVCYGVLLESAVTPGEFIAAIRGTDGIIEWAEDGEFLQRPHPGGGNVESGFYGVYESMRFRRPGGADFPIAKGISDAVGAGHLIVCGHSLGAALATYLTFDLTPLLGARVSGRYFASPRPGDGAFVRQFHNAVADYQAYAYELDLVPRVPLGLGYSPVLNLNTIAPDTAQARIKWGFPCFHHIFSYCAMLNFSLQNWAAVPTADATLVSCITGANIP
jgi:triacylglycerol lipase